MFFINLFTADEVHVYLYVWTVKIQNTKFLQSSGWLLG